MKFVELNRFFLPLSKDQQPILEPLRLWGQKFGGWLDWADVRQHKRVVILAEASSGKSDEFRNQVSQLAEAGAPAFMVRVEELADQGFEAALEPGAVDVFEDWRAGTERGWFFLDALDEARLNRKSFESALKRFARDLGQASDRAYIFVSCRVSDWDTARDRALIEHLLPVHEPPAPEAPEQTAGNPLLDPLFEVKPAKTSLTTETVTLTPAELLIVQLGPLSSEQCRALAIGGGIENVDEFMSEIDRNALDAFTDRPGDVLDLAEYWRTYGRFGSFADMVEHGITTKLREPGSYRGDNDTLSPAQAREGAERIAAALTLGKSFTLRVPNRDPDPSLASGAIDPALVLDDWTEAQRATLARRGIFAPSTYGRIRFHHRSTQEYLTARWLLRLLRSNCPQSETWSLIFADRYGVETVVPSLRPAAAWLALWDANIREEIIRREPALLIDLGDPGSLPREAKRRLLINYATKHAVGELARHRVEDRSLWMFADPALADALREAWHLNTTPDFRHDLLRLIRDGKLADVLDLSRSVVSDPNADDNDRIVALQALIECNDGASIRAAAATLVASPDAASARLASMFAFSLYPAVLTTSQLLTLIERSQPPRRNSVEGFSSIVDHLYGACPDASSRRDFVGGVADLCLTPPFGQGHQVSAQHAELAARLLPIARREVQALENRATPDSVTRLLMVVERADMYRLKGDEPALESLVSANKDLNRALFWADVADCRQQKQHLHPLTNWGQIHFYNGRPLWRFDASDLTRLAEDMRFRDLEDDRRLALNVVASIMAADGGLASRAGEARAMIGDDPVLLADLDIYLAPPPEFLRDPAHDEEMQRLARERAEQTERNKASWVEFADDLRANPDQLRDPAKLKSWQAGAFRLKHLTVWLQNCTEKDDEVAPRDWRLLEAALGPTVAAAYRDGMKIAWRLIPPKRTERKPRNGITFSWTGILSFAGIGLEASENPAWGSDLTDEEAMRAARHGCYLGRRYPDWMDQLIEAHPETVVPVIKTEIAEEWASSNVFHAEFLNHFAHPSASIPLPIRRMLPEVLFVTEPPLVGKLEHGVRIIRSLTLEPRHRVRLLRLARKRLAEHTAADRTAYISAYMALLLYLAPDRAVEELIAWMDAGSAGARERAQHALAALFDRDDPLAQGSLAGASVESLQRLVRLAYQYVRPEDDAVHEGAYTPDLRDRAEGARDTVLTILLYRPGADAFRAMRTLADDPIFQVRARRYRELAREKAERDSELPPWTEQEVVTFEKQWTAPVKTGADLFRVLMGVLGDIQHDLVHGDVTSRPLLQRAKDEDEVQNWIVEQLNHRSRGRFHAHREAEVAQGDKPDVIVASTSAPREVAIEIKHGGMGWTTRQLEAALRGQLATDYLKPAQRRHGAFVITHHGQRRWRDPDTGRPMSFHDLMEWLSRIAETLVDNPSGAIEVRCHGIDASPPGAQCPSQRKRLPKETSARASTRLARRNRASGSTAALDVVR